MYLHIITTVNMCLLPCQYIRGTTNSLISVTLQPRYADCPGIPPPVRIGRSMTAMIGHADSNPPSHKRGTTDGAGVAALIHNGLHYTVNSVGPSGANDNPPSIPSPPSRNTPTLWVVHRSGALEGITMC